LIERRSYSVSLQGIPVLVVSKTLTKPWRARRHITLKIEQVSLLLGGLTAEFENQLAVLKSKITLLEGQLEAERAKTKNLQEERDEAIRGMASALNESEGIKSENKALKLEIVALRRQYQTNVQLPHPQGTTAAKERVKDRVEAERKKDKSRAVGKREGEGDGDHSFIQVCCLTIKLTISLTRLMNCVRRSGSSEHQKLAPKIRNQRSPKSRIRQANH
jgi:hypothetical protein